jgi:hypothetical protein
MKKVLIIIGIVLAILLAARTAGDAQFWGRYWAALAGVGAEGQVRLAEPRIRLAGNPSGLARATPDAESLLPAALEDARKQAIKSGAWALIVHRHGHRVFEYFESGRDGNLTVAGGELAALPYALALGVLADNRRVPQGVALKAVQAVAHVAPAAGGWRNPWSHAARERFTLHRVPQLLQQDADGDAAATLSQRVWLPLGAGDAWLWGRDDAALRVDCCLVARLDDWTRLGDLLLGLGTYDGERIASPDWIRALLPVDAEHHAHPLWLAVQSAWTGDEPPVERDVYGFDLGNDLRIWLAPRRGLQVVVWAGGGQARDTLIPNIILRGLNDQAPPISGDDLHDLVPGH